MVERFEGQTYVLRLWPDECKGFFHLSLVIEGKLIFTKQSFTGKNMHEKSKEKTATGENVFSFNTLNSVGSN